MRPHCEVCAKPGPTINGCCPAHIYECKASAGFYCIGPADLALTDPKDNPRKVTAT